MGECTITSKICLTFLCLIFWAASAGLLFVGVEVFVTYNNVGKLTQATYTLVPATIIICVGVFMFILGVVGCIGGCKESKCLLAVFFCILLLILVGEFASGFLGFAYRDDVEKAVREGMTDALTKYDNDTTITEEVDYVQRLVKCCGVTNYTDWFNADVPWSHTHPDRELPGSCCADEKPCYGIHAYPQGCLLTLKDKFNAYLGIIGGIAFGFALLEILAMICSCIILCRTQKDLPYSELHEEPRGGGLRV